jgi:regulator of RNase E activity RraA
MGFEAGAGGEIMTELGVVRRKVERAERAAVEALGRFGVATVHEAMGRLGLMKPYMLPIYPGALISGTAVTVLLHPGDNWMMHVAAQQIEPGDIIVGAITADCTDGYFGDLLATSFMAGVAKALIIDAGDDVRHGAARNQPHHEFDTFGCRLADVFDVGRLRQALGVINEPV